MAETVAILRDQLTQLEGRAKRLAEDKAYLQLVIRLMNRASAAPGLENTIDNLLKHVVDVIGATNIILYYSIDDQWFYADLYGERRPVERLEDPLVQRALDTREPVEHEHDFSDTQMLTPEFGRAYTWVFPLLVGSELVGVLKMESLHIAMQRMYRQLPTFFHYAALILKNEIVGRSRLKQAYDELSNANAELTREVCERRHAEAEILRLNAQLEQRVFQRTAELCAANEQLQAELAERTRAEQALRESQEHFRDLYENAPNAYFSVGVDGIIRQCNQRAGQLLGYAVEELVGRSVLELYADSASGKERAAQVLQRFRAGETVRDRELQMQKADGHPIWISLTVDAVRDAQGHIAESRSMVVDITERRQAEEADRRLASIVESSDDAIILKALDGTILTWNAGAERLYGYSAEEIVGRSISVLAPPERFDELPQILERIERGERISHYETTRINKAGRQLQVSLAVSPVTDARGKVIGASTIARDITAQKHAEEARRASEQWQRTLFEQSPVGIWEEDFSEVKRELDRLRAAGVRDFRTYFFEHPDAVAAFAAMVKIVQINEGTLQVFGASRKEEISTSLPSYFREDSWDVFREELIALADGGLRFESEIPIWSSGDERRNLFIRLTVVPGFEQTLARVLVTFTDVTALKRAEQRLRAVFDNTFQFVGLTTPDGILVDANRGALDLARSRRTEVIGKRFWDTPWWRHDAKMRDRVRAAVQAASQGQFVRFEATHPSPDGGVVWVDFSLTPVTDERGEVVLLIPEGRDITERKRAEEALRHANAYNRSLIEASLDPLVTLGMSGKITDVNTATEEVTGWSRQELIGRDFSDYFTDRQRATAGYLQVLRDGHVRDYALDLRHRDGHITSVLYHASLYRDEAGRVGGVFAAARDITERKKAEERFHHLQLQLAHMGRLAAMGEMVAGIAHEVNQPLYSIENYAKACSRVLAQNSSDLSDLREWTEEIARSAVRAGGIIQRLRAFVGRAPAQRVATSTEEIIRESISLVAFEARRLRVHVETQLPHEDPIALVDRIQTQQVLVNLLQNAFDALEEKATGERTVAIRSGLAGHSIEISVADNGPGLPESQVSQVFEPFVTTKPSGLGMGLAISRSIIEAHGGRIWVTTNREGGATFHFTIPRATVADRDS